MAVYTTIDKPTDYFETILYTGNGGTLNVGGLDFTQNFTWIKNREDTTSHFLYDTVRGAGNDKEIRSSSTGIEGSGDGATHGFMSAFRSDGFTVNDGSSTASITNASGDSFVSWNWRAGTSFTNDASSTGIGTIDSTGSVNETAGFSIVSYTSTGSVGTVKHGLSTAPQWILFKRRSGDTENWPNFHQAIGATHQVYLNATDAKSDSDTRFNDVAPTSSVFTLGTSGDTNGGTSPFICYCFSERQGYSKFGSYVGSGDSNGPFVYTGFKPAWVMFKNTSGNNWGIIDNKRDPDNGASARMLPNTSGTDNTGAGVVVDFLSNGFKLRNNDGLENPANEVIYMAFAESPFVTSTGIPTTAR
tara:strand:+ start:1422 stop:2498 length:1077 start_codon:yes stop_codon:yes gene_type:complete